MLWSSLRRVQAIDPCKALFENNNCRLIGKLSICRLVLNSRVTVKDRLRCAVLLPKYVPSEISLKSFRMDSLGKVSVTDTIFLVLESVLVVSRVYPYEIL